MAKLIETLKSILIVLLLLSSLCLLLVALPASIVSRIPLPQSLSRVLGTERHMTPAAPQKTEKVPAAAEALTISVRNSAGRHTVSRDSTVLSGIYDTLSSFLSQALTSAHNPKPFDGKMTEILAQNGIVFSFGGEIPAQALCRWLSDGTTAVEGTARDYLLVLSKNRVTLLLYGSSPMQYETTVSAASLNTALEAYAPDGSSFAAEVGSNLHPLTLWEPTVLLPVYTAGALLTDDFAPTLATALDFNPYGAGTYTDPQGNTIFSETDRTLSVSADGTVTITILSGSLPRFTAEEDAPAARIETVRSLLHTIAGEYPGDAKLQLTSCSADTCEFTYILGGIPVAPAACIAKFDGPRLTEITVTLRTYHLVTGQHRLMPIASAAAIAEEGARLTPAYSLSAAPGWSTE